MAFISESKFRMDAWRLGDAARATFGKFAFWDRHAPVSSLLDWLALLAFVLLPWTTSGTAITLAAWVIVALPTVKWHDVVSLLRHPAASSPLILWTLMAAGTLWSQASWEGSLLALKPYFKLLMIPLFMLHFRRSQRSVWAFGGLVASTIALMLYSWASWEWPALVIDSEVPGVPVKDYIYQGVMFVLATGVLAHFAIVFLLRRHWLPAGVLFAFVALFIVNLMLVTNSRTTLVALPVLVAIVCYTHLRMLKGTLLLVGMTALAAMAFLGSPTFKNKAAVMWQATVELQKSAGPSSEIRIELWRTAVGALREAPLLGKGTGSTQTLFAEAVSKYPAASMVGFNNPHNQTLAVGIQVGLVGIIVLYLMWLAHLRLFVGASWATRFGLLIVSQNIVCSLFNSHITDSTAGWLYVVGVGVLGGAALRERAKGFLARPIGTLSG